MSKKLPIFGKLGDEWLDGPFRDFDNGTIQGLAHVHAGVADVLAIVAKTPGYGDGGRFLDALKRSYATVRVWSVTNPDMAAMLRRRGFVESQERHLDDELAETAFVYHKPTEGAV